MDGPAIAAKVEGDTHSATLAPQSAGVAAPTTAQTAAAIVSAAAAPSALSAADERAVLLGSAADRDAAEAPSGGGNKALPQASMLLPNHSSDVGREDSSGGMGHSAAESKEETQGLLQDQDGLRGGPVSNSGGTIETPAAAPVRESLGSEPAGLSCLPSGEGAASLSEAQDLSEVKVGLASSGREGVGRANQEPSEQGAGASGRVDDRERGSGRDPSTGQGGSENIASGESEAADATAGSDPSQANRADGDGKHVKWYDDIGRMLASVKEFEPSEEGDAEDDNRGRRKGTGCGCALL